MALYGQILISMEIRLGVDLMSTIPLNSTFNSVMIDHVLWNIYKFSSHHGYIFDYSFYQFGSMKIIHWLKERALSASGPKSSVLNAGIHVCQPSPSHGATSQTSLCFFVF